MIDTIFLYLQFPPTLNDYYGNHGHVKYVKKKGKAFKRAVRQEVMETLGVFETITEPMNCEVTLYMPDRRRRDLDNYMKALLDSLSPDPKEDWSGLWEDDSLIDQLTIHRGETVKGGLVLMEINPAGPIQLAPAIAYSPGK